MNARILVRVDADLSEHIPQFLKNRERDLDLLAAALASGDFDALAGICHKMHGSAGGYGFEGLGDLAKVLEEAAKSRNASEVRATISQIREYLSLVDIEFVADA